MNNQRTLERAAVRAHADGIGWPEFFASHRAEIEAVEPWDREARRKLVTRLSVLLVAGNLDGHRAVADWWEDDAAPAYPATDDTTAARCLWSPSPAT